MAATACGGDDSVEQSDDPCPTITLVTHDSFLVSDGVFESFTADTRHILGEAPGHPGLFVAAGFNTTGVMTAAGAGRTIARWLLDGAPDIDVDALDVRRFEPWQANDRFMRDRARESVHVAFAAPVAQADLATAESP